MSIDEEAQGEPLLRGRSKHRRTQSDYMAALLDRVTIDTWTKSLTQQSLPPSPVMPGPAPGWISCRETTVEAPTPLAVIVQRISGNDQLVNELAIPAIYRAQYQDAEDAEEDSANHAIKAQIAAELAERIDEQ